MKQLLCPIAKGALNHPKRCAIETEALCISYETLETTLQNVQYYLRSLALPSKNVGIIANTALETILLYFAAIREGFSVCMLCPKDPPHLVQDKVSSLRLQLLSFPSSLSTALTPCGSLISEHHLSTYLYTSGSSATPKIAALSFKNHYYSALGMLDILHLTPTSRYLLSLPLYHVSGLSIMFRSFVSGSTLVLPHLPAITSTYLLKHKISHVSLVLTQYVRLLADPVSLSCEHLKAILLGGSFFPPALLKQGLSLNLPLYLSYGLTEMGSVVTCNPLLQTKNVTSSGFVLPYRTFKIDHRQELWVGGDTLFQGYYSLQTHTVTMCRRWFRTKDLACYCLKEGLVIQGRADQLIISGGENIQPEEIEQQLLSIPGVERAVIIAAPDPQFGQKMIALIDSNAPLSFESIAHYLALSLPRYKLPKHYLTWPKHLIPSSLKLSALLKEELRRYVLSHESLEQQP